MPITRYGLIFPEGATNADIELMCFARSHSHEQGGLGRYEHLHNAIDLIWNEPRRRAAAEQKKPYDPDKDDMFIWNEWTELMMRAYCDPASVIRTDGPVEFINEVVVAGAGGTWKTTTGAMFFLCLWLSSPHNTRIILTSTTGDGLRARVWKELVHFWRAVNIGNLVQSRTMIQFQKGDDGAGIYGIAVESDGNVEKAVNKIIGRHNTHMGVFVDEMPTVSGAIVEAAVNLSTGAETFHFGGVGNPGSHFDPHGRIAEPEDGWESITVDSESWRTKRKGVCIHLDGRRSPRIGADDKFPGLIRQRDLDQTVTQHGEDSPQMWKQRYGFWAPEGLTKTVLSEAMIEKFRAREKAIWVGETKKGAGVDPAFEGADRCILRIGKAGVVDGGKIAMTAGVPIQIKLQTTSTEPIHYQLARQIHEQCEREEVAKDMLAIDSTGEGDGVASILIRDYGYSIERVEFGGRASSDPISKDNPKPAHQEWMNKVTEVWYRVRTILQNGQMRELDDATAAEFCSRRYELRGTLVQVEPKKQMKSRSGRSPDLADACAVLVMLFHKRGLLGDSGGSFTARISDDWNRVAKKMQLVDDEAYLVGAE